MTRGKRRWDRYSSHMASFNPDAAAKPGSGIFGLPSTRAESRVVLLPVPFDATTSYGGGASGGPEAILRASAQVDLFDLQFGRVYEAGIFMEEIDQSIAEMSREARSLAAPIIEKGGAENDADLAVCTKVDAACERVNAYVYEQTKRTLAERKIPGLIGGDHSTPFGAIRACAEAARSEGMGILQIDAHMDLRDAFEGFRWSHASIMFNVLSEIDSVKRLVQIGIRDFGEGELRIARHTLQPKHPNDSWITSGGDGRVAVHFDMDWERRQMLGASFESMCKQAIESLPRLVYVSFDIDGLDPALCSHTGTPVPGGLSFNQAAILLEILATSGRRIVGFDLNEVSPDPDNANNEWDANVGARMLYKLCGAALASQPG